MNINLIDFVRVRGAHRPGHGALLNTIEQLFTFGRGNRLGVRDAGDGSVRMEHDRGSDDGASQTTAPHLVHPRDMHEPDTPQRVLERARRGNANHAALLALGVGSARVLHAGGLALEVAQVVELRATDLGRARHLDPKGLRRGRRTGLVVRAKPWEVGSIGHGLPDGIGRPFLLSTDRPVR